MSDLAIGGIGFVVLFLLIALRVPIGVAMLAVGMVGFGSAGFVSLLSFLKTEAYWRFSSFDFSVIPLFLMMGNFATRAGVTQALFRAAAAFIGHFRGGLAMAAIGGCAAFGTISGSSLATAAMMGQVSLPELRRYKYLPSFATGCLAAGGTLGALIPPSIPLIIYAIMVEGNIVQLFQAAVVPGVLAAIFYIIVIAIVVRINPAAGPAGERANARERLLALRDIWTVILIFAVVMGGIYSGAFTPTEGAGIGAIGMALIAVFYGGMRLKGFIDDDVRDRAHLGDDLRHSAGGRRAQRLPRLLATADLDGGPLSELRPAALPDRARNDHPLPVPRLHHGLARHDPDHHSDLLADHHGARLRSCRSTT